jgi:hypothetical protein
MRQHVVYGIQMTSDFDFSFPLPPGGGEPDLVFSCQLHAPEGVGLEGAERVFAEGDEEGGPPAFEWFRCGDFDLVRIREHADHYVFHDRIVCHLRRAEYGYLAEIQLFGMVLGLWLERRGTLALHASGAVVGDAAVAFLATKGGGKTTTATAMVAAGDPLLTDDLLALDLTGDEVCAQPGYPQLRLWPEQADHFLGGHEHLDLVHPAFTKRRVVVGGPDGFGELADGPRRLRRIYLPAREEPGAAAGDHAVRVEPVAGQQALIELVRHTFLPQEVHRFGWQDRRLAELGRLVAEVPVRRLRYPSGLERLPALVRAIRADVADDEGRLS